MEEWRTYKYTDLCSLIGGGTPKTSESSYWGGDIPWLSVKDFGTGGKYVYSTEKHITEKGLNNSSTKLLQRDDIIISARGTIGAMAMIPFPMAFNQSCFGIRANNKVDPHFLFYLTKTKIAELQTNSHGSVFDTITRDTFDKIECYIPDISTQRRIATILSNLDDKILLNNRINHNLEEQAQALYKSWFIDFEPFKDGKFVDSELGMIPDGWHVGTVNEIINIQSGFPFKSESFVERGQYLLITIKAVQDGQLTISGADSLDAPLPIKMPNYCILKVGDILLSLTGNVGRVCIVDRDKLLLNQRVANLAPKEEHNRAFTYFLARNEKFKDCMYQIARGTAQLNLSPVETGNLRIVIPPPDVMNHFSCVATPMFEAITTSLREMISLQSSRDSLLPQLLSGQLTC